MSARTFRPGESVDFIIVGSGAAGGVIARELSHSGFTVVVLEQGPRFGPGDFQHDEFKYSFLSGITNDPEVSPQTFRDDPKAIATRPRLGNSLIYARMVGGSSTHFTANYWRFREIDFTSAVTSGRSPAPVSPIGPSRIKNSSPTTPRSSGRWACRDSLMPAPSISTGGLFTSAWVGAQWPAITAAAHHAQDMAAADIAAAPAWSGFQYLSAEEARDVDAIAAQIGPSGAGPQAAASPGAREADAVYFIDRSLATFFAGWAADFRRGLSDFQANFRAANPGAPSFAAAPDEVQIAHLKTVEHTPFFASARTLTVLGMFSAPKYGGNFQGSGWKLMGFEDRHAFTPPFGYYDANYAGFVPYTDQPMKSDRAGAPPVSGSSCVSFW